MATLFDMRLAVIDHDTPDVPTTFAPDDEDGGDAPSSQDEANGPAGDDQSDDPDEYVGDTTTWVLAVENQPTGDGRIFAPDSLSWRELPLPFMARDTTQVGHDDAVMVGHITDIAKDGPKVVATVTFIDTTDERALNLQSMIRNGDLRWVSVDVDSVEGVIVWNEDEGIADIAPDEDGNVEMPLMQDTLRVDAGRIIGATAVPMQAIDDAQLVAAADIAESGRMTVCVDWTRAVLTAALADDVDTVRSALGDDEGAIAALDRLADAAGVGADNDDDDGEEPAGDEGGDDPSMLAASITVPDAPPAAWFDDPRLTGPTEMTVTDDGRVFGHLALWNSCHVGFQDRCVMAPKSKSGYAAFTNGTLVTAEGTRVSVGQITTGSGHASMSANATLTKEFYDHTGWAAADVAAGEDEHGIWIAGAVRPGQDVAQLREFMAAAISGDWRKVNGALDLVGIASVNVPGFQKLVASVSFARGEVRTLVAAAVEPCNRRPIEHDAAAERIAASIGRHPLQLQARRDELAHRIGRHPNVRRDELAARVKAHR